MIKKTNILLVSLVAMMSVGAARSENATKDYVDSQDLGLYNRIRTQDERIGLIRDWVNPKVGNSRAELETTAQDAYRAINELNAGKQNKIDSTHKLDAGLVDGLATVATTGDYDDLTNKPEIPTQVQSDWTQADDTAVDYIKHKPTLATVATSGDYDDLSNKPDIPEAQVNADWNASTGVAQILNKPTLATVATSGDYDDLQNKPAIPTVDTALNAESNNAIANSVVAGQVASLQEAINYNNDSFTTLVNGKQNKLDATAETGNLVGTNGVTVSTPSEGENAGKVIIGGPSLATVATTGDYGDLINTPSIPAAQVNADWNAASGVAAILNKPAIPTVDDTLDTTSHNAIENAAVATALADKADASNVYTKNETYTQTQVNQAITAAALNGSVTVDDELSSTSENPVQNKVVTGALGAKVPFGNVPQLGQYVLGFVDGVQTYIPIVDANGDSGAAIAAFNE